MSASINTSDSSSSAEKVSDASANAQNASELVNNEQVEFTRDLVTYFILLAFFVFGVYYFLTMPEMGLLSGVVIIATVFPVMLRTCFYLGIIAKMTSKWLVPHIRALAGK